MTKGIGKTGRKRLTTPKTRNRHTEQGPYPDLKGFLYQSPCCTLGVLVALLPLLQGHRQKQKKNTKTHIPLAGNLVPTRCPPPPQKKPKKDPKRTQRAQQCVVVMLVTSLFRCFSRRRHRSGCLSRRQTSAPKPNGNTKPTPRCTRRACTFIAIDGLGGEVVLGSDHPPAPTVSPKQMQFCNCRSCIPRRTAARPSARCRYMGQDDI